GMMAARVVRGAVDSDEFLDFIVEDLPSMNPFPEPRSILIMDNCRIHHTEALFEHVRAAG
ncbi:hypothetical protein OF83DRAFT_1027698, partial [Amylostereum chailletii]